MQCGFDLFQMIRVLSPLKMEFGATVRGFHLDNRLSQFFPGHRREQSGKVHPVSIRFGCVIMLFAV